MSESKQDRETLEALERMGRSAARSVVTPKPAPIEAKLRPDGAATRSDVDETYIEYRCLSCGYPLMIAESTRCSECGASFSKETLARWFSGAERDRLDAVLWLVRLGWLLKLLLIPVVIGFYWPPYSSVIWLGNLSAVAWMLGIAARGRWREPGARYSIVGLHLIAILLLVEIQLTGADTSQITYQFPSAYAALEAAGGLLLVMSLHCRETGIRLAGSAWVLRGCMISLVTIPIAAFVISRFVNWGFFGVAFAGATVLGISPASGISYLLNLAIWAFIWHRVYRLRKTLFPLLAPSPAH